jgi:hypothetical protein
MFQETTHRRADETSPARKNDTHPQPHRIQTTKYSFPDDLSTTTNSQPHDTLTLQQTYPQEGPAS